MSEWIEHIRQNLAEFNSLAERFVYESYLHDVSRLLERIDKLQADCTRMATEKAHLAISNRKLELENERLRQACTNYAQRLAVTPKTTPGTG